MRKQTEDHAQPSSKRPLSYDPLPSQKRFHDSESRFKGFSGPIGSGKSKALAQEAIRLAMVNPGRQGLLGAPTFAMLRDATQRALVELLEIGRFSYRLNKGENVITLTEVNSPILLRSMEEYERLRGTNLAWFGLDELTYTPEEAWLRLEGRLRDPQAKKRHGFAVWTPKGFDWVHRRFLCDETGSYDVTIAQPFENTHLLSQAPDFYERLRKTYDEQFFQQEVLGSYLNMSSGLVYKMFSRTEHLQSQAVNPSLPLLWALDFNVDPMCSVVVQMDGDVARVVDEIMMRNATTAEACEEFLNRYQNHQGGWRIYGDASGNKRQSAAATTDYQVIRSVFRERCGVMPEQRIPLSNPLVRDRISLVNAKFRNAAGEITLYIDSKCKELIKDFEQLSYQEGTTMPDKGRDSMRSHLSDALGYVLWWEFRSGPAGEQPTRLF